MHFIIATTLSMISVPVASINISITPHDKYSSSVGVLGCFINTNRVAYWPWQPGCDNMCKRVTSSGRSVTLLHVDISDSSYDVSYDAWNYLNIGQSATVRPTSGGGIIAEYEDLPMDECMDIITEKNKRLALMAANSIAFYVNCANTWVGENSELYNIQNQVCTLGYNEVCRLDISVSNQPSCPHMLGAQTPLLGLPVKNIDYGTGVQSIATA